MCCRHGDRGTCGMWNTRKWSSSACGACFRRWWASVSSGTCTWRNRPCRLLPAGEVLSHALQTKEVGLLGPGFTAVDCCAVVADENVGVVRGPDEELHEEPARPAVVPSHLVQACDLVVLVHVSHVPETRGKVRVPGGRTFMQDCVKRSRGLTYLV